MNPHVEQAILAMVERSQTRQGSRWADICTVGELLGDLPRRSPERKEIAALLSSQARCGTRTQANYCRLWRVLRDNRDEATGEVPIPANIDYSTALEVVRRGGGYDVIRQADAESWTLAEARLWAQDKARVVEERPQTLWARLTRAIPREYRKRVEPMNDAEVSDFIHHVRDALGEMRG